ncbi:hypothetical protein ACJJTC_000911 [Scirpophaga incertulas]
MSQVKQLHEEGDNTVSIVRRNPMEKYKKNVKDRREGSLERPTTSLRGSCGRCGYTHGYRCPAYKVQCKFCNAFGHYAKMCKNKKVQVLRKNEKIVESDEISKKPLSYAQVLKHNNRPNSYTIVTEKGQILDRNRRDLIECKNDDKFIVKRERVIDDNITNCENENIIRNKSNNYDSQLNNSENSISDEAGAVDSYKTKSGRNIKKPQYLSDYI